MSKYTSLAFLIIILINLSSWLMYTVEGNIRFVGFIGSVFLGGVLGEWVVLKEENHRRNR